MREDIGCFIYVFHNISFYAFIVDNKNVLRPRTMLQAKPSLENQKITSCSMNHVSQQICCVTSDRQIILWDYRTNSSFNVCNALHELLLRIFSLNAD